MDAKNQKINYIIVAHPDDETLFFASLPLSLNSEEFKIICVTDANADGHGEKRRKDFEAACEMLGVKQTEWLGLPDVYEKRLCPKQMDSHFKKMHKELLSYKVKGFETKIFTHGPIGEYMHPHHQDVSNAVINFFSEDFQVFCSSYNCHPDFQILLTKEQFATKTKILTDIYGSETNRFVNLIPATWCEGFMKVSLAESNEIYSCLQQSTGKLDATKLSKYMWLKDFIEKKSCEQEKRLF